MKKSQLLITALCASALVLGACTPKKPGKKNKSSSVVSTSVEPVKNLVSIAITTAPSKVSYLVGEAFDKTGMVVTATYDDGSTRDVTSECVFSPSRITAETTSVTVTYGGKSQSQSISVVNWSSQQKDLLAQYLQGFTDVPYYPVQGAALARDSEYACLSYMGGTSSAALLEAYAALFDETWSIEKTEDDYIEYYGLKYSGSKQVSEDLTISVSLYGIDNEGYVSEDGSGTFCLDISDGCYYSWAEFQEDYEWALSTIYGEYDEETWEPIEFPDPIQYSGSVDLISAEEEYDDSGYELVFYVAQMEGVSAADYSAFVGAFEASPKWKAYVDPMTFGENCDAFYHESEKVAFTYFYNSTQGVFVFALHEYTSYTWEAEKIADYIKGINNVTTIVVPALNIQSARYITEEDEDGFVAFVLPDESATNTTLDTYSAAFESSLWTVEKIVEDPETPDSYFYSALSKDHAVGVQIGLQAYSDAPDAYYVAIFISANAPLTSALPGSSVVDFYALNNIEIASVPSFSIAAATGGFSTTATEDYVEIMAFEATDDEFNAFLGGFTSPWVADPDNTDVSKGQYAFNYTGTKACVYISDGREEAGYHHIGIDFEFRDWTKTQKEAFVEHLLGVVPPFIPEYSDLAYDEDYGVFTNGKYLIGDLHESIVATLTDPSAGWTHLKTITTTAEEETNYGTHYFYSTPAGTYGRAVAEIDVVFYNETYPTVTGFGIYFEQTDWSPEEATKFSTALHGIVPPFLGQISTADSTDTHFEGYNLYDVEGLAQFDEILTPELGWTKTGEGAEAYFTKASADEQGYAKISFAYYEGLSSGYYWVVDFVANT